MTTQALAIREQSALAVQGSDSPLTVAQVLEQVNLVQQVMRNTMKEGEHFGKIPGCGDKPTLLQPGAQKLLLTFRFNPDYSVETVDMGGGHREYRVICRLTNAAGVFIGSGVGSATTLESKWRYRSEATGKDVPQEYWQSRDQSLLGGNSYTARKTAGAWKIYHKVEHDNPADYYNTCLKMAKKRALVDATLTRTAASDIFTQDVEEIAENLKSAAGETELNPPNPQPTEGAAQSPAAPSSHRAEPVTIGGVTGCECVLESYRIAKSKPDAPKPWEAWFCTFDASGDKLEAGTFSKTIGDKLDSLKGEKVQLNYKPGKKPGTYEIVSIEPVDDLAF